MSIIELKKFAYVNKYAGYLEDKKRRETWPEAVSRSKDMMLEKYSDKGIDDIIEQTYNSIKKKEILGSQRSLQFGGKPIVKHNARIYNCIVSYCDRPKFFQECMYLLLCGCGTGFSVQKHHVDKLPALSSLSGKTKRVTIDDSIEGWSDALGILLSSYFEGNEYSGTKIVFDYSKIRPAGSRLSSSSGKAPGPEPLKKALNHIRKLLNKALEDGQKYLKPINAYDIVMYAADAVVSGGVRRSATICLFSPDDEEMATAKTGSWFVDNPQRGRSNNSVLLIREETTFDKFKELMEHVKQFGEPGFVFSDSAEFLVNPCVEIGMWAYDIVDQKKYDKWVAKKGLYAKIDCDPAKAGLASGWQACNLSTINGGKIETEKDFYKACLDASTVGTLQAGFSSFPYLGVHSENIIAREALLGVSITGVMENHKILLNPAIQKKGAEIVKKRNLEISKMIGINQAARTTCIKPEGTSSCVLGTSSGIHPHHAKRYIRNVQSNTMDTVYQFFKKINPTACETSVWSNTGTDEVISFCIEVPDGSKTKNQINALELLEFVKSTQLNWVANGKNDKQCTQPWLSHNVSNTITVKPDEWEGITKFIFDNKDLFCAVSLLPESGDKDYPQAPFTAILLPSEICRKYGDGSLMASGLITKGIELFEDNLWEACESLMGNRGEIKGSAKKKWIDDCHKFSHRYNGGDIRKLTYLFKDIYNWKRWVDLNREYRKVDYEKCIELVNDVKPESSAACAGGTCDII